jgi:hypothetical protein
VVGARARDQPRADGVGAPHFTGADVLGVLRPRFATSQSRVVGVTGYGAGMTSTPTVTRRLPVLGSVNGGKAATLTAMGAELDRIRACVWSRFAGAGTAHLSKRQIRDRLMAEQAPAVLVCRNDCGGPPWKTLSIRSGPGNKRCSPRRCARRSISTPATIRGSAIGC